MGSSRNGQNYVWTFGSRICVIGLSAIFGVLSARMLGPSDKGLYTVFTLLPAALSTLTMLAGPQLVLMDVSRTGALSYRLHRLMRWSTYTSAGLATITIVVQAIQAESVSLVALSSYGVILVAPSLIVPEFLASAFQGSGHFARLAVLRVCQVVLPGVFMLGGISLCGLPGALSGFLVGAAIVGFVSHELWWRQSMSFETEIGSTRIPWRYVLITNLTLVLLFLSYRADVFVLNAVSSPHEVGVYSAAVALAELVLVGSMSAAVVRARLYSRDHTTPLQRDTWVVVGLSCVVAVAIAGLTSTLVPLLFGLEYAESVGVVWALLPGICVLAAYRFMSNAEIVRGHKYGVLFSCIVALVVDVGVLWAIGRDWGALGAAIAASASYTAGLVFLIGFRIARAGRTKPDAPIQSERAAATIVNTA